MKSLFLMTILCMNAMGVEQSKDSQEKQSKDSQEKQSKAQEDAAPQKKESDIQEKARLLREMLEKKTAPGYINAISALTDDELKSLGLTEENAKDVLQMSLEDACSVLNLVCNKFVKRIQELSKE